MPKWSILASFWKPEACGQTVLPDRSVLIGQKLVENAEIKKFKCDILGDFQNTVQKFEFTTRIPSLSAPSFASTQPQNLIILANFGLKMASEALWRNRTYKMKKKNVRNNEKSCIGVQSSVNRVEPKIVVKMKVYIRKLRKLWKFRCRFYFILGTFFFNKNWGV